MVRFLFVGERPSARALQLGATWRNGGLSGAVLHRALRAGGWNPLSHRFWNVFVCSHDRTSKWAVWRIRKARDAGDVVVGMGRKVQRVLTRAQIPHLELTHPAARGRIRYHENYDNHVAEVLRQAEPQTPW